MRKALETGMVSPSKQFDPSISDGAGFAISWIKAKVILLRGLGKQRNCCGNIREVFGGLFLGGAQAHNRKCRR